ncbi:PREDICTED: F-box/LRR-repeat protein At4g14096-like [Ipomoea nil]|uniref:F-box/LRR-repeat protein At4g14096-like n=1 Tax=Ipomoea nil TaxID=35883 RepID=UPI000900CBE7|nr:PREDICTED: F-box/LRR-repeat protein At4g14096-like [Ipomoea nil]
MESPVKGIDFISSLPDSIIHQILARLPVKDVHHTSVLSKGWHRCVSDYPLAELRIPVSDENQVSPNNIQGFYAGAERRVRAFYQDIPSSLRRSRLQIDFPNKQSLLYCNRVLGIVADQERVKEQDVRLTGCPSAPINTYTGFQRILAADSLAVLELSRCKLTLQRLEVKLPNLRKIGFVDCALSRRDRVLHKFLLGSPSVEHLRIRNCDRIERAVGGVYKIVIPAENLKYFECVVRRCYPQTVTMDIQSRVLRSFRFKYSPSPARGKHPPHFRMNIDLTRHPSLMQLRLTRVTFLRRSDRLPMNFIPGALAAVQDLRLKFCRFQPRKFVPDRTILTQSLSRLVLYENVGFNLGVNIVAPSLVSLKYHNSSKHPSNPLSHIIAPNLQDIHIKIKAPTQLSLIASINDELKKLRIYPYVNIQCFPLPNKEQQGIVMKQKLFEVNWKSQLECESFVGNGVCISSRTC